MATNNITNNYGAGVSPVNFLAIKTTNSTGVTGDGTEVPIICDTAVFDTTGGFNTSTGQYLVSYSGKYMITINNAFAVNSVPDAPPGFVWTYFYTDLHPYALQCGNVPIPGTSIIQSSGASFIYHLTAGEHIYPIFAAYGYTTKAIDIQGYLGGIFNSYGTLFSAYLIG